MNIKFVLCLIVDMVHPCIFPKATMYDDVKPVDVEDDAKLGEVEDDVKVTAKPIVAQVDVREQFTTKQDDAVDY